jgi:capsular exopolysaccharide synthesis family protein
MRNLEIKKILPDRLASGDGGAAGDGAASAPPLLAVLWGRRWTFANTVLACVVLAALYLLVASPVYRATATIFVQQNGPRALNDNSAIAAMSETYLQTQADVIQSTPVLVRALESAHAGKLKTFEGVDANPVTWLRKGRLSVEAVKRSDVINVSIESRFPEDAALLADAVVNAYVVEQAMRARDVGQQMVQVLKKERQQLQEKREAALQAMLEQQRDGGVPTFRDGKGNIVLGRLDSLSAALSEAELATIDLKGQQEAILNAMDGGDAMRAYVQGLQFKGRDVGDREYDELRSQLAQQLTQLAATMRILKAEHPRVREQQSSIDSLQQRIRQKEESIAEAQLAEVTARLEAAQQKEGELRTALEAQKKRALDLSPGAVQYAKLESDVVDLQKRVELLDNRIAELNVNNIEAAPFNVRVLQPAMVPEKAVKPNKSLTLAAALLLGCVLGIGFSTLREWQDARLRTPDEILPLLGMPLVGVVPQINRRLSAVDRGQVLRLDSRSPAAEAFRSMRTTLHLGDARAAKTILVASPSAGDGKSTTAGNLAIAFAQSGARTLLIDCNLREPVQHLIFETLGGPGSPGSALPPGATGVTTALSGETKLRDTVLPTRVQNLHLLPCGPVPRNPAELLAGDRFKHLLKTLCEAFDRIVIDSPALESVTDGRILAASADVTVLVLRMNQSLRRSGVFAVTGLSEVGADVLGVVANDVPKVAASRVDGGGPWQYAAANVGGRRGRESGRDPHRDALVDGIARGLAGDPGLGALPKGDPRALPDEQVTVHEISIRELEWPSERP